MHPCTWCRTHTARVRHCICRQNQRDCPDLTPLFQFTRLQECVMAQCQARSAQMQPWWPANWEDKDKGCEEDKHIQKHCINNCFPPPLRSSPHVLNFYSSFFYSGVRICTRLFLTEARTRGEREREGVTSVSAATMGKRSKEQKV